MHFLYIIGERTNKRPAVKVGISRDIQQRILALQAGSPVRIYVLRCWAYPDERSASAVESDIHHHFRSKNTHGEWFNVGLKDVVDFLEVYHELNERAPNRENITVDDLRELQPIRNTTGTGFTRWVVPARPTPRRPAAYPKQSFAYKGIIKQMLDARREQSESLINELETH